MFPQSQRVALPILRDNCILKEHQIHTRRPRANIETCNESVELFSEENGGKEPQRYSGNMNPDDRVPISPPKLEESRRETKKVWEKFERTSLAHSTIFVPADVTTLTV
jgi:hypothetical protein